MQNIDYKLSNSADIGLHMHAFEYIF